MQQRHWELEFPDVFAESYPPHPLAPSPTGGEGEQDPAPLSRSGRGIGGEGSSEAERSCSELETSTSELGNSTSELGTSGLELETSTSELKPSSLEPETSTSELGRSSAELETSRSEVKLSGSEPESLPEKHHQRPTSQLQPSQLSTLTHPGVVRSADGRSVISINEVEDVALPLYQGVMVHQFDFSRKGWVSGTGLRAIWRDIFYEQKQVESQFVIRLQDFKANEGAIQGLKIAFRDIARSTDERTFIGGLVPDFPCGNVLGVLGSERKNTWSLLADMNSFVFDWNVRQRMSGTHLNLFVIEELPLLSASKLDKLPRLLVWLASLCFISNKFAPEWLKLRVALQDELLEKGRKQLWAVTPYERLRLRAILDAVVAHLYGLDTDDFAWILRDCDHPIERVNDNAIARSFDPKGFWRVDKDKPPELHHTVLSQVAFNELNAIGLEAFLNLNNGEGWMLPETLRLADYGLGNSDRAYEFVPVAEKMGARFLPWQLAGTPEESWEECDRHADNLRRLLGNAPHPLAPSPPGGEGEQEIGSAPLSRSGRGVGGEGKQLSLLPNDIEQLNLFDPPVPE